MSFTTRFVFSQQNLINTNHQYAKENRSCHLGNLISLASVLYQTQKQKMTHEMFETHRVNRQSHRMLRGTESSSMYSKGRRTSVSARSTDSKMSNIQMFICVLIPSIYYNMKLHQSLNLMLLQLYSTVTRATASTKKNLT